MIDFKKKKKRKRKREKRKREKRKLHRDKQGCPILCRISRRSAWSTRHTPRWSCSRRGRTDRRRRRPYADVRRCGGACRSVPVQTPMLCLISFFKSEKKTSNEKEKERGKERKKREKREKKKNTRAFFAKLKAPLTTASGPPTKVKTVLLVVAPGSTSRMVTPGVLRTLSEKKKD